MIRTSRRWAVLSTGSSRLRAAERGRRTSASDGTGVSRPPDVPAPRRRVAADGAGTLTPWSWSSTTPARPPTWTTEAPPATASRGGRGLVVAALLGAACLVGLILRWWPRGALWLDEAQSVAFASLPLDEIPGALREDGAPPLYYVVLHGWMWLVGDSDVAVRALSALFSTATVVVVAVLARRRWGPTVAVAATVLVATSPFAIRYAAHARMYALVMLEVVLAVALVGRALEAPRLGRLTAVTIASAALLLTHYWSLYLVITAAAVVWVEQSIRYPRAPGRAAGVWPGRCSAASCCGCRGRRRSSSKLGTPVRRGLRRPTPSPRSRSSHPASAGPRSSRCVLAPWSPPASPSDFASGGGGLRRRGPSDSWAR